VEWLKVKSMSSSPSTTKNHENVIILYHGILLSIKMDFLSSASKWVELENIILSSLSQVQKVKASCFLSYVQYKPIISIRNIMKSRSL
jgi:hypothetical protein